MSADPGQTFLPVSRSSASAASVPATEHLSFHLTPPLTPESFAAAWRALQQRHNVEAAHQIETRDWRDADEDTRAERLISLLRELRSREIDNPFHLTLLQYSDEDTLAVWTLPQGMLDWRSRTALLREALALHAARTNAQADILALRETPIAFPAPAQTRDTDPDFWREYLCGVESPTQVDLVRPAAPPAGDDFRIVEKRLDVAQSDSIRRLHKAADVTLNNVVQAAWSVLLAHYARTDEVLFGVLRSCRGSGSPAEQDALGSFTNVLPLRVSLRGVENAFQLLWQVRDRHRQLRAQECADPAGIAETAGLDMPLFDSVLEFDLRDPAAAMMEMLEGTGMSGVRHCAAPLADLHIQAYGEKELVLRLLYPVQRFEAVRADQLLEHFATLLYRMAQEPWEAPKSLPYLSDAETAACCWPGAQRLQQSGLANNIHGRFEAEVREQAEAVAAACAGQSITYGELNAAANRLAHRLRRENLPPGSIVGLCTERSIEQIVGMLGILKAGCAYLPLDPNYPVERLHFQLRDAGVETVVVPQEWRELFDEHALNLLDPAIAVDAESGENPCVDIEPETLAYVIYTSGSTGQPKGVMVTHRNVTRLFDTCQSWLQAGKCDVWTMFHSFAFDFSVWEVWGALLHGGRLEIVPRDVARSPEAFHALVAERRVTILNQTPSAFNRFVQADLASPRDLSALRLVVFGGEKLELHKLKPWLRCHGDQRPQLVNMYGITETTVHVTWRPILRADIEQGSDSPIGWPLPDLYVRLLDRDGHPVPPGVRGEIHVGGAGVARGYLNRPELHAQRFLRDPFQYGNGEARLYRSGDFARLGVNGELNYLGREDHEVKLRGFRIDLGEIARTMETLHDIREAVVTARDGADGEPRLIAWYVAASTAPPGERQLREQLAALLPEHMLPTRILRVAEIPVTSNNKTDFKALPDPAEFDASTSAPLDPPETPRERQLARLWSEVLERGGVGRHDDFFGLGGDSILALKFVAAARAEGMKLTPREVFNHPVLADLAALAGEAPGESEEELEVKLEGPWRLTPIQRWFVEQPFDAPDHWNQSQLFRVPPGIDVDLLERAMLSVVERHDALHVRYALDERGRWFAAPVPPADALEFSRIELEHLDETERREAAQLIMEEIQNSLSIGSGLLVRAAHFSGGLEEGTHLLIAVHQLAIDAASWPILIEDLDEAYRALAAGRAAPSSTRSAGYAHWAEHLHRAAGSAAVAGEYAYWNRLMQSARGNVHRSLARAAVDPGSERDAVTRVRRLDAPTTAALLGGVHDAYGTDTQELLLAALLRACAEQWPGTDMLRVDVLRHGRQDEFGALDLSRSVGWFDTLHPLALDARLQGTPGRVICDVKSRMRGAPHGGSGWGLLRYLRADAGGLARGDATPAPILFDYLGQFERVLDHGMFQHAHESVGRLRGAGNVLTHALAITAQVHDDRLAFEFRFSPRILPEREIEAFADRYARALEQLVRHCRSRDGITRTPVDFPLAHLTQDELDAFPVALDQVEDILPLSPIQRLYHALSGTDRDVGFDQWVFHLQGNIDERAFNDAWQQLFRRHDALRTIFVDQGLGEPHQVVLREVDFRLQRSDWRLLDEAGQRQRLREFLEADRQQGFDTAVAPLTRITLIRAGDDRWILVWSHHQALVDGWSWPILAREVGELHDAQLLGRKADLGKPGSYRSYIAWLMDRDVNDYAAFWREHLGDARAARSLITRSRRRDDAQPGPRELRRHDVALDAATSRALMQLVRRLRLTPSVAFQAAWALLLSALTARFDVTLGVAFSGRTSGVPDGETTVGPFLNDLPVRVRIAPTRRIEDWLADLRASQADLNHYQNVSPLEVHEWSGSATSARLFDSLIVMQNYASGSAMRHWGSNIRVREFEAAVRTNYPLTLAIVPPANADGSFVIELYHDVTAIDTQAVETLAGDLVGVLKKICSAPDARIDTLLRQLTPASAPVRLEPARPPASGWRRRANDRTPAAAQKPPDIRVTTNVELEQHIARICREVLDIGDFDVDRNFFDVGAQSVSLIEIHERLTRELGQAFPIVRLFQHPTIASLARYLQSGESGRRLQETARRGAERRAMQQQRRRPPRQPGRSEP